jgi:predicted dehydrogenase
MNKKNILLVGAGMMAKEYAKILNHLGINFAAVCRSVASAETFMSETGGKCYSGGLEAIRPVIKHVDAAIVATGVESLASNCRWLIENGIKNILCEKPAGLNSEEIIALGDYAQRREAEIHVAYNRRFYASVLAAHRIIAEDGGALSCNFEFTEWAHKIAPLEKAPGVKENWFLANSTHVVDLAFHLIDKPLNFGSYQSGGLSWHNPAIFSGSGISHSGTLFSYSANWISAGRWGVEICTPKRKLILKPLEKLQEQLLGSIEVKEVENIDYSLELEFKPGLYLQTKTWIDGDFSLHKNIQEQVADVQIYNKILGVIDEH